MAERCDTCRLWRRLTEFAGECHARPPRPLSTPAPGLFTPLLVVWPQTGPDEFCGGWSPLPVRPQPPYRPVVVLVGSSRFKPLFHQTAERLEKGGKLVLMMGFFQHADSCPVSGPEREVLRGVDRHRLDLATEVGVVSEGGYVGEDTAEEVRYALAAGTPVWWLEEAARQRFASLTVEGGQTP